MSWQGGFKPRLKPPSLCYFVLTGLAATLPPDARKMAALG
jgi:hypothetical protein